MSAAALRKLALGTKWKFEDWHLKFADVLGRQMGEREAVLAIYGIFGGCVLRPGFAVMGEDPFGRILHLTDATKRKLAEPYLAALSQSVGVPVTLIQRPTKAIEPDTEFKRECRTRIDRLKVKPTNRGVQL